jgi:hypothetical protein
MQLEQFTELGIESYLGLSLHNNRIWAFMRLVAV